MSAFTIRLQPGEDLVEATAAAARQLGIVRGLVRGGPGSLMSAMLTAGPHRFEPQGPAVEILALSGEIGPGGAVLDGVVADPAGRVYAGRFATGSNKVCITAELMIEKLD